MKKQHHLFHQEILNLTGNITWISLLSCHLPIRFTGLKTYLTTLAVSRGFMNTNNNCTGTMCPSTSLCLSTTISSNILSVKMGLTLQSDEKNKKEGWGELERGEREVRFSSCHLRMNEEWLVLLPECFFVSILGLWSEPSYHRVCPLLNTVLLLAPSCFVLPFNLKDITTQQTASVHYIVLGCAGGLSKLCIFEQDPQPQIALDGPLLVTQVCLSVHAWAN